MDGVENFMSQAKAYSIQMNEFLNDMISAGFTRKEAFKMVMVIHTEKTKLDFRGEEE
jgi:hypothetical protein